jgi:hypothetical protein
VPVLPFIVAGSCRQNGENVKTFKKEDLLELLDGETEALKPVKDKVVGNSRWSIQHSLVFQDKTSGRFYEVEYSVGATEQQDEGPFEYEGDDIEVTEVRPQQRTVTVYEPVPAESP